MDAANNLNEDIFDWRCVASPTATIDLKETRRKGHLMLVVSNIILQLGIPTNIKGYAYLREAIITKVNEPQADILVTKILYPHIAKKFHTSASNVERAIRHAIEVAWNRGSSYRHTFFSSALLQVSRRPTNSEFIAVIADRLILTLGSEDQIGPE